MIKKESFSNNHSPFVQNKFCSIDKNGTIFLDQNTPIRNQEEIEEFFNHLHIDESRCFKSQLHSQTYIVEVYDEPLIALKIQLSKTQNKHNLINSYGIQFEFDISSLLTDEWDRFHGTTINGIPFVMTNESQNEFFNQLDSFDDESITFNKTQYPIDNFWTLETSVHKEDFWTQKYLTNEDRWDLGAPAEGLVTLLPKLKLPSSRILVLGGGGGHDAAHFAVLGHHVTLVDLSSEAILRAQRQYGHLANIHFIVADLFELPNSLYGQFDLIFEHTCYCAIDPTKRKDLVRQWRRLLSDAGYLLGVFFAMPTRTGPPFGGSEWELHQRLDKDFRTLIWQRFRQSIPPRLGREFLVYMQRKTV